MSSTKFYVLGGGRWRELSLDGRVDGWGFARFVTLRGGRLVHTKRSAVLRGLRELINGCPTTVLEGFPLSKKRVYTTKNCVERKSINRYKRCCSHHCMTPAPCISTQCRTTTLQIKKSVASIGTQCGKIDTHTQFNATISNQLLNRVEAPARFPYNSRPAAKPNDTEIQFIHRPKQSKPHNNETETVFNQTRPINIQTVELRHVDSNQEKRTSKYTCNWDQEKHSLKRKHPMSSQETRYPVLVNGGSPNFIEKESEILREPPAQAQEKRRRIETMSRLVTEDVHRSYKELIFGQEDVMLLRRFFEVNDDRPFDLNLSRFDRDDDYKTRVLFKLNPVVKIERSALIERLLREQRNVSREISLKDFVSLLGLQDASEGSTPVRGPRTRSVTRASRFIAARGRGSRSCDDTDKENSERYSTGKRMIRTTDKADRESVSTGLDRYNGEYVERGEGRKNKKQKTFPKKKASNKAAAAPKQRPLREYSEMEDDAIIRYVSSADRAKLVNGNRMWRELQPHHHRATGQFRTWHSLRNRYLRYLLPQLGALLPVEHAARLRADAATGEVKSRKVRTRQNSMFEVPAVQSAWSSRPRTRASPPPSPPRYTPSPPPGSPPPPRRDSSSTSLSDRPITTYLSHARSRSPNPLPRRSPRPPRPSLRYHATSEWDSLPRYRKRSHRKLRRSRSGLQRKPACSPPKVTRTPKRARGRHVKTPTYSDVTRRFRSRSPPDFDAPATHAVPSTDAVTARTHNRRLFDPLKNAV